MTVLILCLEVEVHSSSCTALMYTITKFEVVS